MLGLNLLVMRTLLKIIQHLLDIDIRDKDQNVKTTYRYTLDLKDRLETMTQLAKENLEKSATRYKKHYDGKARNISLKVGDNALVLLSTDNNKYCYSGKDHLMSQRS